MSEETVIRCCAPTLAAIKTGSLFNCAFESRREMTESLRALNLCLLRKGVMALPLRYRDGKALIYLCRIEMLKADLRDPQAEAILRENGYPEGTPIQKIAYLIRRLRECESFPHEIGVFLGYPAEDVRGFMKDTRQGVRTVGCWKVYGDPQKAESTFQRYRRCTDLYRKQLKNGRTLEQLIVRT